MRWLSAREHFAAQAQTQGRVEGRKGELTPQKLSSWHHTILMSVQAHNYNKITFTRLDWTNKDLRDLLIPFDKEKHQQEHVKITLRGKQYTSKEQIIDL